MDVFLLMAFSISLFDVTICCLLHCYHHFECHKHIRIECCPSSDKQPRSNRQISAINSNRQISGFNSDNSNEKSHRFGHELKVQSDPISPRPSIRERMRASSIVVLDEVLQGPKHNNFWCCNVHKRHSLKKHHILCCLYSSVEETEFYPIAVMLYFFIVFITIIMIFLVQYYYNNTFHYSSIINVAELKHHCFIIDYVQHFNNNNLTQLPSNINMYLNIQYIFILITMLWETLLNFYRYYSTNFMAIKLHKPSYIKTFSLYLIYVFIFILLCVMETYYIYIISPIIILTHFIFNTYCIYGFIFVLFNQYKHYRKDPRSISQEIMNELKITINKLAICGICCTIISTIFLALIQVCYSSNIILIFAPIFWIINTILWNITFVKNSVFIKHQCKKICYCQYKICKTNIVDVNRKNSGMVERNRVTNYLKNKKPNSKSAKMKFPNFMINAIELDVINDHKQKDERDETKIAESLIPSSKTPSLIPYTSNKQLESPMSLMPIRMPSNNIINMENIDSPMMQHRLSSTNNTPISIIPINDIRAHTASITFKYSLDFTENNDNETRPRKKSKALELLGVHSNTDVKSINLSVAALHVPDSSNDDEMDKEIVNAMRKQSDSSKRYVKRIKKYKMNKNEHYHNTSSSVFELMVKEGFYSHQTVKSLQELQNYADKQQSSSKLPSPMSNVTEYHASIHPQPMSRKQSSHI
eukprot:347387_1